MTNKEAANRLARIFNKYCNTHDEYNRCVHECNLCNRCKDCYDREAYDMAIKALEKQMHCGKCESYKATAHWQKPTPKAYTTFDHTVFAECSECGEVVKYGWSYRFCPMCGVRMNET